LRDGSVVETPVRVGNSAGAMLEVLAGLSAGEKIVSDPPHDLSTGTKVISVSR